MHILQEHFVSTLWTFHIEMREIPLFMWKKVGPDKWLQPSRTCGNYDH